MKWLLMPNLKFSFSSCLIVIVILLLFCFVCLFDFNNAQSFNGIRDFDLDLTLSGRNA